jgi:hypothetical protein
VSCVCVCVCVCVWRACDCLFVLSVCMRYCMCVCVRSCMYVRVCVGPSLRVFALPRLPNSLWSCVGVSQLRESDDRLELNAHDESEPLH